VLRSRVPEGPGPWLFVLVGKPTDESGFGGAAFASGELGDGDQRGAVQLPDPFLKRVLNVATYEVFRRVRERRLPCGFKDLGAGGIACATSELAAAGGCGADIVLDDAHRVDRELPPEVLLCAETQERYCWVVSPAFAQELLEIYNVEFALDRVHPGAGARVIGRAVTEGRYRVSWRGEWIVDCDVEAITTGRRIERPSAPRPEAPPRARTRRRASDMHGALLALLKGEHVGSREYLYRHYDSEVQGRTWLRPGEGDAAVIRVHPDRPTGVAFAVGGNPFWCEGDPELGSRHAVAEAARNCAVVGARPWALTDCLNFGRPEDPQVMGDLEACVAGLGAAARALGGLAFPGHPLPFVSGNVSLYNQTGGRAIPPSPIVMCAGVVHDVGAVLGQALRRPGSVLVLVGEPRDGLDGSAYRREVLRERGGPPPALSLEHEARLQAFAIAVAEGRWAHAAHDVSDGGLATTLAEMMLAAPPESGLGLEANLESLEVEPAVALFSERAGLVYEVGFDRLPRVSQAAREHGLVAWPIGTVTGNAAFRALLPGPATVSWTAGELHEAWGAALPKRWNEEGT
jgi:phosphoribosylformylglycinamidine synthase II